MSSLQDNYRAIIITSLKEEVPGVKTFTVRNDDGSLINYLSGQFITLIFNHHGKEDRRSFSISSCHVNNEPLSFTVKRIDNGAYSRWLHDKCTVGTVLYTTGAAGLFTIPEQTDAKQFFFFAAGIGITPIYSLIKALLLQHPDINVVLIYSNRTPDEVVFYEELNALRLLHKDHFRIEFLFSNSFNLARARLNKALVRQILGEYATEDISQLLFYVCGPFEYMRMAIYALEEHGVNDNHIRKENFNVTERPVLQSAPADISPHKVTIIHNGHQQTIISEYPDTILKSAKKAGISLPYSCEVGRCGSCAARCTIGKVWHSYNEVLMDTDLRHGSILTCTAYPVDGDITIEV